MKKIQVDFEILDIQNPKLLGIYDISEWRHIKGKPAIIEITLPGYSEPHTEYLEQNSINMFNSVNLGINCPSYDCGEVEKSDLPDGIYTITVKGSPDSFYKEKSYLRTVQLQLEVDKLYVDLDLEGVQDRSLINTLIDIDFLLMAAKANIRYSNNTRAQELYLRAVKLKDKFKNCC